MSKVGAVMQNMKGADSENHDTQWHHTTSNQQFMPNNSHWKISTFNDENLATYFVFCICKNSK